MFIIFLHVLNSSRLLADKVFLKIDGFNVHIIVERSRWCPLNFSGSKVRGLQLIEMRATKGKGMFPWLQQTFVGEEDCGLTIPKNVCEPTTLVAFKPNFVLVSCIHAWVFMIQRKCYSQNLATLKIFTVNRYSFIRLSPEQRDKTFHSVLTKSTLCPTNSDLKFSHDVTKTIHPPEILLS